MRIHGIMLIKDELDVVAETLEASASWCDAVYVYDNGSTDGTWEYIQEASQRDPRIVPFLHEAGPFSQTLRGKVFRQYRNRAAPGDWWCILDSDEIYIDDPRAFLGRVPSRYGEVWSSSYQFYFTDEDARRYEQDPEGFLATPVQDRLRYYQNNWSESRFFRHHRGLVWPEDHEGRGYKRPVGRGAVYGERIRLKHYQYRSPEQIEGRLKSRLAVTDSYRHEQRSDWGASLLDAREVARRREAGGPPSWRDRVVPAEVLHFDDGTGRYIANPSALPPLPADQFGLRRAKQNLVSAWWRVRSSELIRARS